MYSQLVCFVEENDRNLLFWTFLLPLVTGLALWGVGAHAWLLRWRMLPPFAFVGGLGPSLGLGSPPERFRLSVIPVVLEGVILDMSHIRMYVLIVKWLEVPILEKGTLGTEEST